MNHVIRFSKKDSIRTLALKGAAWAAYLGGAAIYLPKGISLVWSGASTTASAVVQVLAVAAFFLLAYGPEVLYYTSCLFEIISRVAKMAARVARVAYLSLHRPSILTAVSRGWVARLSTLAIPAAMCLLMLAGDQLNHPTKETPLPNNSDDRTASAIVAEGHVAIEVSYRPTVFGDWMPVWQPASGRVAVWNPPVPKPRPAAQIQIVKLRAQKLIDLQKTVTIEPSLPPSDHPGLSDPPPVDDRGGLALDLVPIPTCNIFDEILLPDILRECQMTGR